VLNRSLVESTELNSWVRKLDRSKSFYLRLSEVTYVGVVDLLIASDHPTKLWSDRPTSLTYSDCGGSSVLVTSMSSIPPFVCVGEWTCWPDQTNPVGRWYEPILCPAWHWRRPLARQDMTDWIKSQSSPRRKTPRKQLQSPVCRSQQQKYWYRRKRSDVAMQQQNMQQLTNSTPCFKKLVTYFMIISATVDRFSYCFTVKFRKDL